MNSWQKASVKKARNYYLYFEIWLYIKNDWQKVNTRNTYSHNIRNNKNDVDQTLKIKLDIFY